MRKKGQQLLNRRQRLHEEVSAFSSTHVESDQEVQMENDIQYIHPSQMGYYFQYGDEEEAKFSHNAMIRRQVEIQRQEGDFFKVVDETFQLRNKHYMVQDDVFLKSKSFFCSDNPFSILLNVRYNEDLPESMRGIHFRNSPGLWIGRRCAILPNQLTTVFAECILPTDANELATRLILLALAFADVLYLTASKPQYLNQLLSLLKVIKPIKGVKEVYLTDIPEHLIHTRHHEYLIESFGSFQVLPKFPSSPSELEQLQINYEQFKYMRSCYFFISVRSKWLRLRQLPLRLAPAILDQCVDHILSDGQNIKREEIYDDAMNQFIFEILDECSKLYDYRVNQRAERTMPETQIEMRLVLDIQRQLTIEQFYSCFWDLEYTKPLEQALRLLQGKIDKAEQRLLNLNDRVGEGYIIGRLAQGQKKIMSLMENPQGKTSEEYIETFISLQTKVQFREMMSLKEQLDEKEQMIFALRIQLSKLQRKSLFVPGY